MIGVAILTAAALTGDAPVPDDAGACAPGSSGPAILAHFDGLKDRKGTLRLELYPDNDADFLDDDTSLINSRKTFKRIEVPTPQEGAATICMRIDQPGVYALALIHDRDNARKFSFSSDGVGFPGDPKLGWRKPRAAKAAVKVGDGVAEIHVTMKYFRGLGFHAVRKKDE